MPIKQGGRTGKKYLYRSETGEVTYSRDPNVPVGSNVYEENIRKDPRERKESISTNSRVNHIVKDLIGNEDPDDLMLLILEALTETEFIPEVGNLYTFVYNAKTPGIVYDIHPLIQVTEIYATGFRGFNYHWNKHRQYTWPEVVGQLHIVRPEELRDLRTIPYGKFRLNN